VAKIRATIEAGGKLPIGPNVTSGRAEYTLMDLKSLIALAFAVRPGQIVGPDWMEGSPFDIVAKLPDGASKDDAPRMLQSLLEERFKLAVHRTDSEHPVLALVVARSGLKMKPSQQAPAASDDNAPPKPGVRAMDIAPGMRMSTNPATGASVLDLGLNGSVSIQLSLATHSTHMDFNRITMGGLADWLSFRSTNSDGPQVIDMTQLKGNYDASVDLEMSPLDPVSDPGTSLMAQQVQALGLKLESRKATVEQLVIDRLEKMPSAN
jgi:uncharacterized protein (TIGR03435 family)